jgi:hypothetical protein
MLHMLGVLMIHIVMDIFEITISMVNYLLYVIIIMLIYGIKIIRKIPIILTGEDAEQRGGEAAMAPAPVDRSLPRRPPRLDRRCSCLAP